MQLPRDRFRPLYRNTISDADNVCVWCGPAQNSLVQSPKAPWRLLCGHLVGNRCRPPWVKSAQTAVKKHRMHLSSGRLVRYGSFPSIEPHRTPASHGPLGTPGTAGGLAAIFGNIEGGGEERKWTRLSLDDDQRGEQKTRWHHHRRVGSCQRVQPGKTNFKLHEKWA